MASEDEARAVSAGGFARLRPAWAIALLTALAALIALGLALHGAPPKDTQAHSGKGDIALYQAVIDKVRAGQAYYPATVSAQRAGDYALRPFVAVRPPTLAVAMAALPSEGARQIAIRTLALVVFLAWAWRLREVTAKPLYYIAALVVLATGVAPMLNGSAYALHECWAGLLIALSLALRRPERWAGSLIAGLLAVSVRELAAAYLLAMAVLAWRDRRRVECLAWLAGVVVFLVGMGLHAAAVQPLLRPTDLTSQGWLGLGGWGYVLDLLRWNVPLFALPAWVAAIVAPLALLGLLAWRGALWDRLALTVIGYGAAFLVVGRPDNSYWGLLIAPLWPIGLVAAWPGLWSLLARAGFVSERPSS